MKEKIKTRALNQKGIREFYRYAAERFNKIMDDVGIPPMGVLGYKMNEKEK